MHATKTEPKQGRFDDELVISWQEPVPLLRRKRQRLETQPQTSPPSPTGSGKDEPEQAEIDCRCSLYVPGKRRCRWYETGDCRDV